MSGSRRCQAAGIDYCAMGKEESMRAYGDSSKSKMSRSSSRKAAVSALTTRACWSDCCITHRSPTCTPDLLYDAPI